jgi:hypothetical protein
MKGKKTEGINKDPKTLKEKRKKVIFKILVTSLLQLLGLRK